MIYPCVYREHCLSRLQASAVRGLSLCIQGTLYIHCFLIALLRFIPVHTGNIMKSLFSFLYKSVYPCAYREHLLLLILVISIGRFIPVHTGNMLVTGEPSMILTVYPCAYREHLV